MCCAERRAIRFGWFFVAAVMACLAPAILLAETPPIRLVVLGDHGNTKGTAAGMRQVAEQLWRFQNTAAKKIDAVVFLGDNFYPRGLNEKHWQAKREAVLGPFREQGTQRVLGLPRERVHAVTGNHDYYRHHFIGPFGFTETGNNRAAQLEEWTYHFWGCKECGPDTLLLTAPAGETAAELYFFDSALPAARGANASRDEYAALSDRIRANADQAKEFRWRLLLSHHPLKTVGPHGAQGLPCEQWSRWRRFLNWGMRVVGAGNQNLCTTGYRAYVGSVREAIQVAGARFHLALAGHDHNLQLLRDPDPERPLSPALQIVSGAGWESTRVAPADPERGWFTSQETGFAVLDIGPEEILVRFVGAKDGEVLDMGKACDFHIDREGGLERTTPPQDGGCPAVAW